MFVNLRVNPEEAPKLQKLLEDEAFAEALFSMQTPEEVQTALKAKGVNLTIDEIKGIAKALNDAQNGELTEENLEDVAGGANFWLVRFDHEKRKWVLIW